jgi:alpha-D-xyloside xylohydrolase
MKFTDGQWLHQPGVIVHYAAEARSIASADGKLIVHAPTRSIKDRGDSLQGPLLTVTLSSPIPDIVRVRIEHFTGGPTRGPQIPIAPAAGIAVDIKDDADSTALTASELTARVKRNTCEIVFEAATVTARSSARMTPDPLGIILQLADYAHQLEFELIST